MENGRMTKTIETTVSIDWSDDEWVPFPYLQELIQNSLFEARKKAVDQAFKKFNPGHSPSLEKERCMLWAEYNDQYRLKCLFTFSFTPLPEEAEKLAKKKLAEEKKKMARIEALEKELKELRGEE